MTTILTSNGDPLEVIGDGTDGYIAKNVIVDAGSNINSADYPLYVKKPIPLNRTTTFSLTTGTSGEIFSGVQGYLTIITSGTGTLWLYGDEGDVGGGAIFRFELPAGQNLQLYTSGELHFYANGGTITVSAILADM